MASKKRQNLQIASQSQKKTPKKALETASFDNDGEEEEEDEDALEMERNFALLSKCGSGQTSERTEEESDEADEENTDEDDHGEDFVNQRDRERNPPDSVEAGFKPGEEISHSLPRKRFTLCPYSLFLQLCLFSFFIDEQICPRCHLKRS